ncbi:hypothetical protein JTE90_000883 [Oedothorax gibbosus]|uniref:Uncharacterized protein n=1 Tax=Oedothorax gibbosus TaxID=931172 RepID=A0AAV6VUM6_9ARAC|nr:hypothetical protein JTE90_000883 [Oedothorax gibbosus]
MKFFRISYLSSPSSTDPVGPEVRLETPSPLRERRGRNVRRQSRSRSRSPLERRQLFPEVQRQEQEELVVERNDFDQMNILEDDLEQRNDGNQLLNQIQLVNVQVPAPAAVQIVSAHRVLQESQDDNNIHDVLSELMPTYVVQAHHLRQRPENITLEWRDEGGLDLEDFPDVDRCIFPSSLSSTNQLNVTY